MRAAVPAGLVRRVFAAFSQHKAERTPPDVVAMVRDAPGLDGVSLHGDETAQRTADFADASRRRAAGAWPPRPTPVSWRGRRRSRRRSTGSACGASSTACARSRTTHWWHGSPPRPSPSTCARGRTCLRVVPDLARHPIRRLHERGVRVTLNTDDPTVFGRSLTEELVSLVDDLGFSPTEAARLQANAFAVAAMPAAARAAVLDEIDALVREVEVGKA
jgi:hypothetical protein